MPENKPIEAVKTSYRQIKEGMQLTLVIHPDDMPDWLVLAPLGQRMSFAAVPIKDEESEHGQGEPVRKSWDELSPAQQAGIRCGEHEFQRWVYPKVASAWQLDRPSETAAADYVRSKCNVQSRSDIKPGTEAAMIWAEIDRRYREDVQQ